MQIFVISKFRNMQIFNLTSKMTLAAANEICLSAHYKTGRNKMANIQQVCCFDVYDVSINSFNP